MSRKVCRLCGEDEDGHHIPEYYDVPDGCVCSAGEWCPNDGEIARKALGDA